MKKKLTVLSPAKINLTLAIGRKRPDGYHDLTSVFQEIDLEDKIEFKLLDRSRALILETAGLKVPAGSDNLIIKAAQALQSEFKVPYGARIRLTKVIPLGAGLGGGSSNAAAALKALVKLWRIKAAQARLNKIAARLGADVPFFLTGGTALVRGKGEKIKKILKKHRWYFLLVVPDIMINTSYAYSKLAEKRLKMFKNTGKAVKIRENIANCLNKAPKMASIFQIYGGKEAINRCQRLFFNSFEEILFPEMSKLARIKEALLKSGAQAALLSGSGSSVFGVFPDRQKAAQSYRKMLTVFPKSKSSIFLVRGR